MASTQLVPSSFLHRSDLKIYYIIYLYININYKTKSNFFENNEKISSSSSGVTVICVLNTDAKSTKSILETNLRTL